MKNGALTSRASVHGVSGPGVGREYVTGPEWGETQTHRPQRGSMQQSGGADGSGRLERGRHCSQNEVHERPGVAERGEVAAQQIGRGSSQRRVSVPNRRVERRAPLIRMRWRWDQSGAKSRRFSATAGIACSDCRAGEQPWSGSYEWPVGKTTSPRTGTGTGRALGQAGPRARS